MVARPVVLRTIAERLIVTSPDRIILVAIDGVDGAGKTTFADDLGALIVNERPVIRASVDSFHNPRFLRYRLGPKSPEGFFRNSYDYRALKQLLLEPLAAVPPRPYVGAVFDSVTDAPVPRVERDAHPSSVLLFDGIFLHRPELIACWDASIFLRVDFEISVPRGASRDGTSPDPNADSQRRYVEGQRIYLRECDPEARATIVIDYNDLDNPEILTTSNI